VGNAGLGGRVFYYAFGATLGRGMIYVGYPEKESFGGEGRGGKCWAGKGCVTFLNIWGSGLG
jgi:hypothetical protein